MPFVLDSSAALALLLPDEREDGRELISDRLSSDVALVPAIWMLEMLNVLPVAVRRRRLTPAIAQMLCSEILAFEVQEDTHITTSRRAAVFALADRYGLTAYDASYLELAIHRGAPLASLDQRLREAAKSAGTALLP